MVMCNAGFILKWLPCEVCFVAEIFIGVQVDYDESTITPFSSTFSILPVLTPTTLLLPIK